MKNSEKLIRARDYLLNKDNWIVETLREGHRVCAVGSLWYVGNQKVEDPIGGFLNDLPEFRILQQATIELFFNNMGLINVANNGFPASVNDGQGHEAVIKMYERAIEIALEKEAQEESVEEINEKELELTAV